MTISFLGGKLTVFNLCNYAGYGKPYDFFGLFQLILLLMNFCRTIRAAYTYFVVYA
jgi:hypothetical protein